MFTDEQWNAMKAAAERELADGGGNHDTLALSRAIGEVQRLRAQLAPLADKAKMLGALEAENAILREHKGAMGAEPELLQRIALLETNVQELEAGHRAQFDRARDLENRAQAALHALGTPAQRPWAMTAVEKAAYRALTGTVLFLALLLAGCANGERRVTIRADRTVGVFEGRTALASGTTATTTLTADAVHVLTVKSEGCEPETVAFVPRASGGRVALYVLQCLLFPPALLRLPWALSSGELNDFDPESATVTMRASR